MSNPEHSLNRQKRRHAGPLIGMAVVVIAALSGLVWWLTYEAAEAPAPAGAETQIDGRTGTDSVEGPAAVAVDPVQNPEAASGNAIPDADTDPDAAVAP